MKRLQLLLLLLLCSTSIYAQSPDKMSYQAILRDASDALIVNQGVGIQVSVLTASDCNSGAVYVETHSATTNSNGLVSLEIGMGTATMGTFSGIDWSGGPYYLKTETDPTSLGGVGYTITGCTQLLSVPYALHAKTAEVVGTCNLKIGDSHEGGIIFYLDGSGCHGLVAAASDQSTGIQWYNGSFTNTTAYGSGTGAGWGNTSMIVFNQGAGAYAAKICYDLNEGGYSDWYLPSRYELDLMWHNLADSDGDGTNSGPADPNNTGGFAADWYWSSTEFDGSNAWGQYFSDGDQYDNDKTDFGYVRAVRAF
jgi:hypothetical protein